MGERLCVVMPVYNEQEAIGLVLEKWSKALDALDIDYVIRPYNDGSKDDSLAVMKSMAKNFPRVDVHDKPNGGHGNTILTGYREAARDGFDWVFQIDSDDEMGPEKFVELWQQRDNYDFLVGIRDGRVQALPRKIISFISRLCVRVFYGRSIWDVNTPYRLMRVSAFASFFKDIPLTTFAPNVILSGLAARYGLRFFETRVPQHDRTTGEVSIKKWKLLKAAARSFLQTIWYSFSEAEGGFVAVVVFAFLALFCLGTNPFAGARRDIDSSVFLYIGDLIRDGFLPYRDVFDHKGPLIYLVNALGLTIGRGATWGVWLFECSVLLVSSYLLVSLSRVVYRCKAVWFALIPYFLILFSCMPGGNIPESYAILSSAIILYCCFKAISRHYVSYSQAGMIGLSVGFVLMMKYTLAIVAVPIAILYIADFYRSKDVRRFLGTMFFSMLGAMCVIGSCCAYLFANGIFGDFVACYIDFNLSYAGSYELKGGFYLGRGLWIGLACIIANLCVVRRLRGEYRRFAIYNLLFLSVSLMFVSILPCVHDYYYVMVMPFCFFPLAYWAVRIPYCAVRLFRMGFFVIGFVMILVFCLRSGMELHSLVSGMGVPKEDVSNADPLNLKIEDKKSVSVIGGRTNLYRRLGVRTPWRYIYQGTLSRSSEKIRNEVVTLIESGRSRYLIENTNDNNMWFRRVIDSNYKVICVSGSYRLLEYLSGQ